MHRIIKFFLAGLAISVAAASPSLADREPNADERAKIEQMLRSEGFASWEEIELDDDGPRWEVDDARAPDGRRYDVKIDPRSMRTVRRERDH